MSGYAFRRGRPMWFLGGGGGGSGPLSFDLPLTDLGAGLVNTTPVFSGGSGTPTFTRASVAWTKLSTGLWAQVASGAARSCYTGQNTAVGSYGGYFSEAAGIQLVTPTASIRDMTDAAWVKSNMTAAKDATGIDGVANSASTLTATSNGGSALQTLVAAASARTYSCFIRRKTGTGTVTISQGATTSEISGSLNASTYTRVALNASVLNVAFGITLGTSGDAVEVDFNQFEANAFGPAAVATSPMASAGSARALDVLSYAAAGNVDATVGTAYATAIVNSNTGSQLSLLVDTAGASRFLYNDGSVLTRIFVSDGTNIVSKNGISDLSTAIRKRASAWGGSAISCAGDGAAAATGSFDGSMGVTAIGIGSTSSGNNLNGMIANVAIYRTALSDADLALLTA